MTLTERGEGLLRASALRTRDEHRQLVNGMSPAQVQDLTTGLARLARNLTALLAIPTDD